ncbi:adenosine deaminase [Sandarakinorhabdus sp. AAP62]|uniref:adenosine deaminase n=1 Tax=Sandarakinorhabdus sp. AAP62 TaxID=1248916 RepID=UPI0002D582B8|nr:adenosine deaminase [Sandarakinorhabdus sp. AAP62]
MTGFASRAARAAFIAGLPKAELHLHIEGSLEPEMMFALAKRNGISLAFDSVDAIRAAYDFAKLQDFLDIYYQGMAVLLTEQDFFDLTSAYLNRAAADGVRHVEIFFDPQGHTARGVPMANVVGGIARALAEAQERGITSRLIMCFLRHLSEAAAETTLDEALPYLSLIHGVGLDSSEVGHPPAKFARVFARARSLGLKIVAHAGEEGPPDYVWQALDVLQVDRIDHGNRALEDDALVQRIVSDGLTLTVCPLSNLKLCVVNDLAGHPLRRMLQAGLKATVNSDDPAYFGGYVNANFVAVADALDLTRDEIIMLARNSFIGSFLPLAEQAAHLGAIDSFAATY